MELEGIDHVAVRVRDLEASREWYCEVFGFEHLHPDVWEEPVFVGKGSYGVALFSAGKVAASEPSPQIAISHFAFRTTRAGFIAAQDELRSKKIEFEFQDHTISHSIYFFDPDGHQLEVTTYEV